jgi:hypothetical protein
MEEALDESENNSENIIPPSPQRLTPGRQNVLRLKITPTQPKTKPTKPTPTKKPNRKRGTSGSPDADAKKPRT